MQKLRSQYAKAQKSVEGNETLVSHDRVKKLLNYTNKQFQSAIDNQQYQNLDELDFYKDKFGKLNQIYEAGYNKQKLDAEITAILRQNFIPQHMNEATPEPSSGQFQLIPEEISFDRSIQRNSQVSQHSDWQKVTKADKDVLNTFFQGKKNQIQKSQLGFRSVLSNMPQAPKKYPVKSSVFRSNFQEKKEEEDPDRLKRERDDLRQKLREKEVQNTFNEGALNVEKTQYQNEIKTLKDQIEYLSLQNEKLKEDSAKSVNYIKSKKPIIVRNEFPQRVKFEQQQISDRYSTRYQDNNIAKITSKNMMKKPQYGNYGAKTYNPKPIELDSQSNRYSVQLNQAGQINQFDGLNNSGQRQIQKNRLQPRQKDVSFASSHLKLGESQIANEGKNIAIRSKLSFFKSSLILYRGEQFELAVKSSQLINYEKRRINIYVNNRDRFEIKASIKYKYNHHYYDLKIIKKLHEIDGKTQAREEIEVSLINKDDLDEIIEGTLTIGQKEITFLVPAMFLEFIEKRPDIRQNKYEKQRVAPIYQFSNVYSAEEILPIDIEREGKTQIGRTYAISKYHEGYVTLRWIKGKIQIQTIKPWKLFLSYLLFKQY